MTIKDAEKERELLKHKNHVLARAVDELTLENTEEERSYLESRILATRERIDAITEALGSLEVDV